MNESTIRRREFLRAVTREPVTLPLDRLGPELARALAAAGIGPEALETIAGPDRALDRPNEYEELFAALADHRPELRLVDLESGAPTAGGLAYRALQTRLAVLQIQAEDPGAPDDLEALAADPARGAILAGIRATPDEKRAALEAATRRFGVRALDWSFWLDQGHELPLARLVEARALPAQGVSPGFLYVVAIGEGLRQWLVRHEHPRHLDLQAPIDGFDYLGTDTFGSAAETLAAHGLLPPGFTGGHHYRTRVAYNERGEPVSTAVFVDLSSGLAAVAAMLADCRRAFLADYRRRWGGAATDALPNETRDLYTYAYFNGGPAAGRALVGREGATFGRPWAGPVPSDGTRSIRFNALQRLAALRALETMRLFPPHHP